MSLPLRSSVVPHVNVTVDSAPFDVPVPLIVAVVPVTDVAGSVVTEGKLGVVNSSVKPLIFPFEFALEIVARKKYVVPPVNPVRFREKALLDADALNDDGVGTTPVRVFTSVGSSVSLVPHVKVTVDVAPAEVPKPLMVALELVTNDAATVVTDGGPIVVNSRIDPTAVPFVFVIVARK